MSTTARSRVGIRLGILKWFTLPDRDQSLPTVITISGSVLAGDAETLSAKTVRILPDDGWLRPLPNDERLAAVLFGLDHVDYDISPDALRANQKGISELWACTSDETRASYTKRAGLLRVLSEAMAGQDSLDEMTTLLDGDDIGKSMIEARAARDTRKNIVAAVSRIWNGGRSR